MSNLHSPSLLIDSNIDSPASLKRRTMAFVAGHANSMVLNDEECDTPIMTKVKDSELCSLDELTDDDGQSVVPYDITSVILVGEEEQENPYGNFSCHMNNEAKEFVIEIPNEENMKAFTQSAFLNIVSVAEQAGAKVIYICLHNSIPNKNVYVKDLLFVGFELLSSKEKNTAPLNQTHTILKFSLDSEDDDDDSL